MRVLASRVCSLDAFAPNRQWVVALEFYNLCVLVAAACCSGPYIHSMANRPFYWVFKDNVIGLNLLESGVAPLSPAGVLNSTLIFAVLALYRSARRTKS